MSFIRRIHHMFRSSPADRSAKHERGQVIVIVALGMLGFIAMVALVVDGGHAWGEQRDSQNGTDAASEAGAVVLAKNLPFTIAGNAAPYSDDDVLSAVQITAGDNNIDLDSAYYTDFNGNRLAGPIAVGSLGAAAPPATALGVEANGSKEFDTFLAGVIGFQTMTTRTSATARTGVVSEAPPYTVLPITFPVTVTGCDNTNGVVSDPNGARWTLGQYYIVPLCSGGPGNVGWLDWDVREPGSPDPCDGTGNGEAELVCSVDSPSNPAMQIPDWYYVSQTGNQSDPALQDALNQYSVPPAPEQNAPAGTTVLIPLFDATCSSEPTGAGSELTGACSTGPGTGQSMWYHLQDWTSFEIDWVDVNGGSRRCSTDEVISGTTGNGSTGCFGGWFRGYMGPGVLRAPGSGDTQAAYWGVALIR
jgi:hypothetical protein